MSEDDGKEKPPRGKPPSAPRKKPWYRRPGIVGIIILVIIGAAVAVVLIWRHSRNWVGTDDAYIDVVSERVSPRIAGRVIRVLVDDNQDVTAGQLLVQLDPADNQARLEQARASEAEAEAELAQARAHKTSFEAEIAQAEANRGVAQANAENAESDRRRYENLHRINPAAVSPQQLDSAEAAAKSGAAQVRAAEKAVAAAQAQAGYGEAEIHAAEAGLKSALAQVKEAELALSYTEIRARLPGRIASKTVQEGNYVTPGANLMAIVPRDVYVTANFKETQLDRVRPGQPVTVSIDAYPELHLPAHVGSIEPATGQAFSVLPAENATGNWVKVLQRVPVKILFDQTPDDPARRLGPGMSVEVSVRVR